MPITMLDPRTALVLIDLQRGITALPTLAPADGIVTQAARLAAAFRARGLPVLLVHTGFATDGADMLMLRCDAPVTLTLAPDFAELRPELGQTASDILIVKHQWDAFYGTDLDLQLRRRQVTEIVLAGIATSLGVESTARQTNSRGYQLAFATDALTDFVVTAQANSVSTIFPRIGQLDRSEAIVSALRVAKPI